MKHKPIVITSTYKDSNDERNKELEYVKRKLSSDPNIIWFDVNNQERMSFQQLNQVVKIKDEQIAMICNADCYPDPSMNWKYIDLELSRFKQGKPQFWCLSRWDESPEGKLKPFHRGDSQDAWMWIGKLPDTLLERTRECLLGIPGVDNRIAAEAHNAGFYLSNPCRRIKIHHVHNSGIRNYEHSITPPIPGPWLEVEPS